MAISMNSTATVKITGAGSVVDGRDYLPQDPPTLNPSGRSVDGISYPLPSDIDWSGTNNGIPIVGKRLVPVHDTLALGGLQPDWNSLPDQLIPYANRSVKVAPRTAQTWGTWDIPEITYLGGNWGCSKSINGCGVLIVEPSAGGTISFSQTVNWTGLILVKGNNAGAEFKITQVGRFYGAIILTGPESNYTQNNNGLYRYSSLALKQISRMLQGFNNPYLVAKGTWKE